MPDDARVCDLVDQVLNDQLLPEDVCARDPELLTTVRERVDECRNIDVMLERLFPSDSSGKDLAAFTPLEARLPAIPGYEVLGVLGRGGIGVVYRVRHIKLNRVMCSKCFSLANMPARSSWRGFMREARAVAAAEASQHRTDLRCL